MIMSANLCRCRGLNDKGSGDASEESGAVWLLLGVFEHEFIRRCLVHRRRLIAAFVRVVDCITVDSGCSGGLVDSSSLSLGRMTRVQTPVAVTPQQRALARI